MSLWQSGVYLGTLGTSHAGTKWEPFFQGSRILPAMRPDADDRRFHTFFKYPGLYIGPSVEQRLSTETRKPLKSVEMVEW